MVELAAGDSRLGRGHVVVRGRAGIDGSARKQVRGHVGIVVVVGGLDPARQGVDGALLLSVLGARAQAAVRRGQRVGSARDGLAVALADGGALALALAVPRVARDGAHSGLRPLGADGRGGGRGDGRGQQAVAVGVAGGGGGVRAQEGRGGVAIVAASALDHGLAGHACGGPKRGVFLLVAAAQQPVTLRACRCRRRECWPAWRMGERRTITWERNKQRAPPACSAVWRGKAGGGSSTAQQRRERERESGRSRVVQVDVTISVPVLGVAPRFAALAAAVGWGNYLLVDQGAAGKQGWLPTQAP